MKLSDLKIKIHEACLHSVQQRIEECKNALREFQEAANQETKSSAGDKYETGRAMMQLEKEKVATQLDQVLKQQRALHQIKPEKKCSTVQLGAMTQTSKGFLYISVSLGKLSVEGQEVICISPVSPLGKVLLDKEQGAQVTFNKTEYQIIDIS